MQLDYFDSRTELIWETARRLTKHKNQTFVKNDFNLLSRQSDGYKRRGLDSTCSPSTSPRVSLTPAKNKHTNKLFICK